MPLRAASESPEGRPVIQVENLEVILKERRIFEGANLDVRRGEILGVIGPSGTGKSVMTRAILGLVPKAAGKITILGSDVDHLGGERRKAIERRLGVMFQHGALFSALTVKQNVQLLMREYLDLSPKLMNELAMLKIAMVGLAPEAAEKFPSELSGGMVKRAALARALALDPDIVFLDEPTSGLDPIGAGEFDDLIVTLKHTLGLTVFMVTHDLDSLFTACDRIVALAGGKVIAEGPMEAMLASEHPWLQSYFHGKRARAAAGQAVSARDVSAQAATARPKAA